MSVPGSNILAQALTVINAQSFAYSRYETRTLQPNGLWVTTLNPPSIVRGSLQPISRQLQQELGLDMQKNYVNIFLRKAVIDIARDVAGDQFVYGGVTYQALSKTPWFLQDGWDQVLAIEVPRNAG